MSNTTVIKVMNKRKAEAAERKFVRALLHLQTKGLIDKFGYKSLRIPRKNSVELTGHFEWGQKKWRMDYEIKLDEPLPKVDEIRGSLWKDLWEQRNSLSK